MDNQHLKDTSKLPKWARDHIEAQQRRILALEQENTLLRGDAKFEGTNVFIRNHVDADIPLPRGTLILFKTGDDTCDHIEVGFNHKRDMSGIPGKPDAVQVRCGNGAAVVIPSARNVVHIHQSYDY